MGNVLSEEEDVENSRFVESFTLDSPEADKQINFGTAAPNCQPKHTQIEQVVNTGDNNDDDDDELPADVGQEVAMMRTRSKNSPEQLDDGSSRPMSSSSSSAAAAHHAHAHAHHKHRRSDSSISSSEERRKRQHLANQQQQPPKKLSYIQMAKLGYQELVNAIIRPPRADYKVEALGPPAFNFCGKRFTRTDFTLRTKRGYNLECSHWEPVERVSDRIPVVVYMHGNSSARVEVIPQLSYLLSLGLAVFAFDFAGSGKSDGEYVSLGYFEREDLSCVVAHLRATNVVSTIALWGRSMGASTALMFGDRDPSIACMILDSAFADLTQLCEEMVEKGREQGIIVPNVIVSVAIRMLQSSVKKQAGFNIKHISPITHADKCFIPALFVAGEHDDFIKKHHSEDIYERYAGDKNLIVVEGDHNSPRPKFMFDSASIFLQTCLQIPNNWALDVPVSMNLMCPPWFFEMHQQKALQRRLQQQQQQQQQQAASRSQQQQSASSITTTTSANNRGLAASSSSAGKNKNASSASSAASTTSTGFNHDEMGMTAERQRVIQASLFKMLGQADTPDSAGSESDNNNLDKNRSNAAGADNNKVSSKRPLANNDAEPN